MPLPAHAATAADIALAVVAYRGLVSPLLRWCAERLGSGRYPETALNGAYPERAPRPGPSLAAGAALLAAGAAYGVVGSTPPGAMALVPEAALLLVWWKYLTLDYDAALSVRWQRADRIVVLAVGAAALLLPALALAALGVLCGRLGGWTHHSKACIRLVKVAFCWSLSDGVLHALGLTSAASGSTALVVLLGTAYLSHYVVAARSKAKLGRRPWSWTLENRTDLLVASSYSWGWARFVPARTAATLVNGLRPASPFLNAGTMVLELAGLVAFADEWCFVAAVAGAVVFNCVVALTSGLLFWENIGVGMVLAGVVSTSREAGDATAFGLWPWLFSNALMAAVLAGWAWRPTGLGWWDTPFTARVVWTVRTRDGKQYGLHNDFFSPHDREYARALGNPLVPEPFVTFSLGGVEDTALRDLLVRARPHQDDIEHAKHRHGTVQWSGPYTERHTTYLRRLLSNLNAGAPKSPLPRFLSRLKAPGGHLYYWGDLPRYRRDRGPVSEVAVWYREELYSSERRTWLRLRNQFLFALEIPIAGPH
ncbi:hypothetical protein [Streptomyces sclerotialus]|uniref:hypothetical protein n=1 Tax=Streptomyces sclerotialus TaxID=1957 RepID=UPI00068E6174